MAIDFTLTEEQKQLQADARDFAQNVLAPVVREADAEPARFNPLLRGSEGPPVVRRRTRHRRRHPAPFELLRGLEDGGHGCSGARSARVGRW